MARTVRGGQVETRSARLKLVPRPRPYWRETGKPGLHLGYRRLERTNGSWIVRRYQGTGGMYETKAFAQADDYAESDGHEILTYYEAMFRLSGEAPPIRHSGRYVIATAVDDYVGYLKLNSATADEVAGMLKHYVVEYFGADRQVSALTEDDFAAWPAWALANPPTGRRKKLAAPKKLSPDEAAEKERKRKERINRVMNNVLGCFNWAHENKSKLVPSDAAWSKLGRFSGVEQARIRWLEVDEAKRLTNASEPEFRKILQAGLLTGARWSELRRLCASDFDDGGPDKDGNATVLIAKSKAKKARRIYLTDEGRDAFLKWTAGLERDARIFTRANGESWGSHDQHRPMAAANAAAGIKPPINFHNASRHTYASALVKAGVHLSIVAQSLGHRDTRMVEKHYGHLAPSHIAETIRAKLPSFGVASSGNVVKLRS